jgi:hypothetical protein
MTATMTATQHGMMTMTATPMWRKDSDGDTYMAQ